MKKIIFISCIIFCECSIYPQSFEIKQITSGDFDAKNPFISQFSFWDFPLVYLEVHNNDSSNIALMGYDANTDTFLGISPLTTGNALHINPYEDFNHGIAYQTNEIGNWDIAYIPYATGSWGPTIFLTSSSVDETNLSPFYTNDRFNPMNNYVLFQRSDTIFVLEYDESVLSEEPVFVNTNQHQYSDFIGIYCFNAPNYYPRVGIAVETDSAGNRSLVYKYKPINGQWEEKSIIKENCECRNPSLQFLEYSPYLIFEDSTANGFRPFYVYDWEVEKDFQLIPDLLSGNISDFNVDLADIITSPLPDIELEYFPHSYFVSNEGEFKIRLNKLELGDVVGDTLVTVHHNSSRMTLGALGGNWDGEAFYTIWEDSSEGHIHLFGRRQLYPVGDVSDEGSLNGFRLDQNYPNPFNPKTNIRFRIAEFGFVSLKVFDVLGNEIATLVNEDKPADEYEIIFDATGLTSGIYFYKLTAGDYIQTQKMIYLK
jgi:hypothetical protein